MTEQAAGPGDALVIEKPNGQCSVNTMNADGVWESLRSGVEDVHAAWTIARTNILRKGCIVWYRHESESNSAIRPY